MAEIERMYVPSLNKFKEHNKQLKDKITPEEWNNLWNILSHQADETAKQLKQLHDFVAGGGDVGELITLDGESIADILKDRETVEVGKVAPSEPKHNALWFDTEERNES